MLIVIYILKKKIATPLYVGVPPKQNATSKNEIQPNRVP